MKKLLKALALCLLCAAMAAACYAEDAGLAEAALYDDTIAGWHIVVEDAMVRESMQNVTVELGYTDVQTDEVVQTAPEGMQYCLVKLYIEKAGSREKIVWDDIRLTDGQGREYARAEDSFIEEMGMKRMPGTPLNFGVSQGWIAFEIDLDADALTLSYPFEAETFSCPLEVAK